MNVELTLTLTSADTNYNLNTLIQAAEAVLSQTVGFAGNRVPTSYDEISISSDAANDGSNPIWLGDAALSASNYGFALLPNQAFSERSGKGCNDISTLTQYLRSHAATQVVHFRGRIA